MKTTNYQSKSLFLLILVFLVSVQGTGQETYKLKNQDVEIAIDGKGDLVTLKNLQTGHNYAAGKPLWRLYFDRKNEKDIEVQVKENQPVVEQTDDCIILKYNGLTTRGKNLDFKLILKVKLEGSMVRFLSEVTNNELHTIIRELQYPLVGNCQISPDHKLLTTETGGRIYPDPKKQILSIPFSYMGPDHLFRQMGMKYPAGVSSNCFALTGNSQGLYLGSHDPSFQDTWHGLRMYPDANHRFSELEVGLYKFPNCLSGQSWKNDANVISPYNGDWHETSRVYRTWANTWWEHRDEPRWVKQMIGFQRIILKHQYGETLFPYSDFATRVKKAGDQVGINVVFPFGWWNSGMDNGYPDSYYETDPDQGGDEAWKRAIADYKKDGGKVLLYFNGKLIDTESNYYRKGDGHKVCFKGNTGTESTEAYRFSGPGTFTGYYNSRSFVVADTKNPKWQQKLKEMADRAIELGANSVFYDQLGYGEKDGVWDLTKEFPVPELKIIADKGNVMKMIHDYIDSKDKELAIGTEHITDVTSQYMDYVHSILNLEAGNCFIDWFRYTFPEIILTDRNLDGDEPNIEWLVNKTVLLGLRSNVQTYRLRALIDEEPRHQKHLTLVNGIKEKYNSLLLLGKYQDTEGFSIDNAGIEARSYVNGNQMAVVMAHQSDNPLAAQLVVPGYKYKEASMVGEVKIEEGTNGKQHVTIGKNGLAVMIFNKL